MIVHYVGGNIDAVYFPADNSLRVIKTYDGLAYFDTAWDAAVKNDGKISSRITSVDYRLIITKDNIQKILMIQPCILKDMEMMVKSILMDFLAISICPLNQTNSKRVIIYL